jgi:hypothetical protein
MGTLKVPVPVTGLVANFSPMPRIEPPPFGTEIEGKPPVIDDVRDSSVTILACPCVGMIAWLHLTTKDKIAESPVRRLGGLGPFAVMLPRPRRSTKTRGFASPAFAGFAILVELSATFG